MIIKDTPRVIRHRLSPAKLRNLIDNEARRRLRMSGIDFIRHLNDGTMPESVAKRDIEMLVKLLDEEEV